MLQTTNASETLRELSSFWYEGEEYEAYIYSIGF